MWSHTLIHLLDYTVEQGLLLLDHIISGPYDPPCAIIHQQCTSYTVHLCCDISYLHSIDAASYTIASCKNHVYMTRTCADYGALFASLTGQRLDALRNRHRAARKIPLSSDEGQRMRLLLRGELACVGTAGISGPEQARFLDDICRLDLRTEHITIPCIQRE